MHSSTFQFLGLDHIAALVLTLGIALALIVNTRKIRQRPYAGRFWRYLLASFLILVGGTSWIFHAMRIGFFLPLHLCDFALVFMIWCLLRPKTPYIGELAFFWGLAASSQAILTPDLTDNFPSLDWILFFSTHCGVVLSAVYLMVRGYVSLRVISVFRAAFITLIYAGLAGVANWIWGTNFGYLAAKPDRPSILDYFGPWPYYIIGIVIFGLVVFFLCYALSRLVDHLAK